MGKFSFLRAHHFSYLPTLVTESNERMFVGYYAICIWRVYCAGSCDWMDGFWHELGLVCGADDDMVGHIFDGKLDL